MRAGTRGHLGWWAAPQPRNPPRGTAARSPARGPRSRARATLGAHLQRGEAARSWEAPTGEGASEEPQGRGLAQPLTDRFILVEEGGLERERVGEVGHVILERRTVVLYLVPMEKEKPSLHTGNKRLRGEGTPIRKLLPFSKRQRTLGPGGPAGPTAKPQTQLWCPPRAARPIIFGCHARSSPVPSRRPSCCHTIPRDLVAQVCVIPESCWNAGLDQSKSQRPHRVSQPGGKASSWEKHKAPFRIQSLMHMISHSCHIH